MPFFRVNWDNLAFFGGGVVWHIEKFLGLGFVWLIETFWLFWRVGICLVNCDSLAFFGIRLFTQDNLDFFWGDLFVN